MLEVKKAPNVEPPVLFDFLHHHFQCRWEERPPPPPKDLARPVQSQTPEFAKSTKYFKADLMASQISVEFSRSDALTDGRSLDSIESNQSSDTSSPKNIPPEKHRKQDNYDTEAPISLAK